MRFVFETVFQSNLQRTGSGPCYRLVTYLSPSLIFLTIYMILQFRIKQFGKFQNHIVWIWKQWLGSFALKIIFCTARVRDETFRNGKRYEDKVYSLLSPTKYGIIFFIKNLCTREQTFWGKFMGGCFTQWLIIRSCKEGEKSNTTNSELDLENTLFKLFLWVGDFM